MTRTPNSSCCLQGCHILHQTYYTDDNTVPPVAQDNQDNIMYTQWHMSKYKKFPNGIKNIN